jgi:UDP-GlcNAc:undecaprenyl-phosphate GlcNAc-1-phosphate transferase
VLVMVERIYEGRSPFVADRKHIHHRLLALGFHHYEAVFAIYVLQSALIAAAYFLRFESDWLLLSVYLSFCLALVGFLKIAPAMGWRMHGSEHGGGKAAIPSWVQWLRGDRRLLKAAFYSAIVAIPSFLFAGTFMADSVPRDVGQLSLAMLVVLLLFYFRHRHQPFHIVERAIAYVAGICVVYLVQLRPGASDGLGLYCSILFVVMGLAVVIGFRVGGERFRITPMDFLIVFVALTVPNLPNLSLKGEHLGLGVAMIIVLFYSIELVLNNIWRRWDVMRITTYLTLAVLGVRGVMGA